MADNPKLTIELVDKGGGGSSAQQGGTVGSGPAPYDSIAAQHERITQQGFPNPSSVPVQPLPPIGNAPLYSNPPGFSQQALGSGSGAIDSFIKQVLDNSQGKTVTADELAALAGIKKEAAQTYIEQYKTPSNPVGEAPRVTPADAALERFSQQVKESQLSEQDKYERYVSRLNDAQVAGKLDQSQTARATKEAQDALIQRTTYQAEMVEPPVSDSKMVGERIRASQVTAQQKFEEENARVNKAVQEGFLSREQADKDIQTRQGNLPKSPVEDAHANNAYNIGQAQYAALSLANSTLGGTPLGGLAQSGIGLAGAVGAAIAVPGIGTAIGAVTAGIEVGKAAINAVVDEANRAVEISRRYSPEVAVAEGLAEVRRIQADLRTSNRLGDEAADYVTARSRISSATQGIRDTISEPIMQELNKNLNAFARAFESIDKSFEDNPSWKKGFQGFIKGLISRDITAGFDIDPNRVDDFSEKWFNDNFPHLPLPAPFVQQNNAPGGVQLAPIPGLNI